MTHQEDFSESPSSAAIPVAVVGLGCRFPGAASGAAAFWELLAAGRSGITEVPADRWDLEEFYDADPDAPGRMYARHGGFIEDVREFDAGLFGVPSHEAVAMDPQHRLMLEVAWEALEHAGIAPDSLRGSRAGVFVGMGGSDYERWSLSTGDDSVLDAYSATGRAQNMAANRLSYALGLEGPSLVVDTACSSSLVAVHLAVQALRSGECEVALAAGVNLMLSPGTTIALSKGRMLSPEGQCKTFDAGADGYVRGEGCGVVVLRRLSEAQETRRRVWAIVRGTAVNQDGRSNGLTAPKGAAQEDVVRRALRDGDVQPADVGYVEAHGTGTALGDPIEVRALSAVLGEGRDRSRPVALGSVKTNIGHLEAGAGIAGFIKAVLVVHEGTIPPHLNLSEPSPFIAWDELPVTVPTQVTPWPEERRLAGVSSFGFGGTNAHVVLESPPSVVDAGSSGGGGPVVVKVAGRGVGAVREGAARLASWVRGTPDVDVAGLAWAAGVGRAELPDRAAVVTSTVDELTTGLDAIAQDREGDGIVRGRQRAGGSPRVGFVVPGQGPRLAGALAGLYGREPVITEVVDAVAAAIGPVSELPLSVLLDDSEEAAAALQDTAVAQPVLFTVAVALGRWWASVGVRPDMVLGHSAGAYAAAVLAGVCSLEDGVRLIAARAELMGGLPPGGAMAAVFCPAEELENVAAIRDGDVVVASYNGPREAVISGPTELVTAVMDEMAERGVRNARLRVSYASHGPMMEPVLEPLGAAFRQVELRVPETELISDSTGEIAGPEVATVDYWVRHTRRPVLFSTAMRTMLDHRVRVVIELGPGGLLPLFMSVAGEEAPVCAPSVTLEAGIERGLLESAARVWAAGVPLDWARINAPCPARLPLLPPYPFQRETYWPGLSAPKAVAAGTAPAARAEARPEPERPRTGPGTAGAGTDELVVHLRELLVEVMDAVAPDDLDADTGLFDIGLTSAMVVRLRARLESDLGVRVATTVVFEHPTIRRLARYLADVGAAPQAPAEPAPVKAPEVDAEPIAIVGMACRFPGGANDLGAYWRLLREGRDAVTPVPDGRWEPCGTASGDRFRAGFLNVPVDAFDAEAFGIAPREARAMDPQQRLLLEVTWEALEDAGVPAPRLEGTGTAVYVGITTSDYLQLLTSGGVTDAHVATGNAFSAAAGRLSYFLGAQGPSMAVDTACSSSLVATHLAIRSLRSGETDLSIVAGVNLILSETTTDALTSLGALAPDGRCKTFAASADGYGRGEGAGALILKRLSDAVADGDRVWAVVRGSAVNQDGRSVGLTAPNGAAQRAVIAAALRDAGAEAGAVGYVEAHGTGTALGDPIELGALRDALRADGSAAPPLLVGSAKANVGHLEAAAGMAGLIKTALVLHHGEIPPHLRFGEPNPFIEWDGLPIEIPAEPAAWPPDRPRLAGVSAFGFSGTNAHLLVEEAPRDAVPPPTPPEQSRTELLVLSAKTPQALRASAEAYRDFLTGTRDRWADIARTAALHRAHLPFRASVSAHTAASAAEALASVAAGERAAGTASGEALSPERRRLIFAFGGQGAQWAEMGRGLLDDPVCARILRRCDEIVERCAGWSLLDELCADRAATRLSDTAIAQPAIVAVEAALTARWRAWGVTPDAIVGHSVGEVAAAHAAGSLDLETALRVAVRRGEVMAATRGSGAMVAVAMPPETAAELIAPHGDRLVVAAVNGPHGTVLAGDPEALAELEPVARRRRVRWATVQKEYAFHSPAMRAVRADLLAALPPLDPADPVPPVFSTVTGDRALPGAFGAEYWADNMVEPVLFRDAIRAAAGARAHNVVLEVGPHAVLGAGATASLDGRVRDATALASMRARRDARATLLEAAGALHTLGFDLDHEALHPGTGRRADLPRYPWQRQRYWMAGSPQRAPRPDADPARHTYEIDWRPAAPVRAPRDTGGLTGTWLVIADTGGVGERVADRLAEAGEKCVLVPAEAAAGSLEAVGELLAGLERPRGLVHCGTLDADPEARAPGRDLDAALAVSCRPLLSAARAAEADDGEDGPRVWVVTRGGAGVGDGPVSPSHGPVWGLGRVFALEHPRAWGGLIDLDPAAGDPAAEAAAVAAEVLAGDGEDQVAYRAGERRVARLCRVPSGTGTRLDLSGDAAYLITGGRGSLGLRVARRLADRGARHLILTGRRPLGDDPADPAVDAVRRLREDGVTVHTPEVDVADADAMGGVFDTAATPWPPVRGVVHAAGAFDACAMRDLTWDGFRAVLRAKVEGTLVLDALFDDAALDFFVMFSSASAVWGSAMAGHYAAANHFEDVMAHDRAWRGLPGLAIDWGWWAGGDLVAAEHLRHFESIGLDVLPDEVGLAELERLTAEGRTQSTVAPVDWVRFLPVLAARRRRPLLEELGAEDPGGARAAVADRALLDGLREASALTRLRTLEQRLQREAAAVLGLADGGPPLRRDAGFGEAGMDSVMSVELRDRVAAVLGVSLPATVAFEHPTVADLAAHLLDEVLTLPHPREPDLPGGDGGTGTAPEDLPARLDEMSEEELLELLGEELEQR